MTWGPGLCAITNQSPLIDTTVREKSNPGQYQNCLGSLKSLSSLVQFPNLR